MTLELWVTIAIAVAGWIFGFIKWLGESKQSKRADTAQAERDALSRRLTEAQEKIAEQGDELLHVTREHADATKLIAQLQHDDSNRFIWEISQDRGVLYRLTNKSRRTVRNVVVTSDAPPVSQKPDSAKILKPGDSLPFFYVPVNGSDFTAEVIWSDETGNEYLRSVRFKKEDPVVFME